MSFRYCKALEGDLVPTLPEDGDARELLKEIEGLRETKASKSKGKKYEVGKEHKQKAAEPKQKY